MKNMVFYKNSMMINIMFNDASMDMITRARGFLAGWDREGEGDGGLLWYE